MLAPKAEVGSWVSEAAREKFMAAYERAFALWPQPVEEFDVETATATTRVHAYRPHPGGEPVVLLTGAGFNASGWYPHVAALATAGPVYGVDAPGDPNPSILRAPLTPPESCAAWLDELLGKLSHRPAHLVGPSSLTTNSAPSPCRPCWSPARAAPCSPRRRPAPGEASCRTRRSPSCPAATAASTGSMS